MKKELAIMEAVPNSGDLILERGYKNVLLTNTIAVSKYGMVNVKVLITTEMCAEESLELLRAFADNANGATFLAWFPLNGGLSSNVRNNFGMGTDESEEFCVTLIFLLGLKSLAGQELAAA